MDKYRRVEKEKKEEDDAPVDPNEVRITQQGKVRSYISYANGLFTDKNEKKVVFKAMGHAIGKAVKVAEVLKHRIVGLHQITQISSVETVDVYEPLEEGLDRVEQKRFIPSISIELSLEPLDTTNAGYQPPIAAELVSPQIDEHDLPARPKKARPAKGDGKKREKKEKPAKASGSASAAAASAAPLDSGREELEKQESAEDTKESGGSKPPRVANSKRGGRGRGQGSGGRGEGKSNGDAAPVAPANNNEELKGEAAATASGAAAAVAPKKKNAPRKPKVPLADDDAGKKKAANRAAETTDPVTDNNGPEQEHNGGRGGRGRGGARAPRSSRGRGRGRGGRGEAEGKEAATATVAPAAPVGAEA